MDIELLRLSIQQLQILLKNFHDQCDYCIRPHVCCTRPHVYCTRPHAYCTRHQTACVLHQASRSLHLTSCLLHLTSCLLHQTSCLLHQTSCSLHQTSFAVAHLTADCTLMYVYAAHCLAVYVVLVLWTEFQGWEKWEGGGRQKGFRGGIAPIHPTPHPRTSKLGTNPIKSVN